MKRTTYAVLAGSFAFGLTAAAATGVAFTISSVQNVPGTDSDTEIISTTSCDGTYAIEWTIDQNGYVTAFTATRTAPSPEDPNGSFCESVPAEITVSRSGMDLSSYYGTTDASGNFSGSFDNSSITNVSFIAAASDVVKLEIGPNAGVGGV